MRRSITAATRHHRVEHHRAVDVEQAPAAYKQIVGAPGDAPRCLQWVILSACRSGEARLATWAEIDLQAMTWTIPASRMKARRAHRVPITPAMRALLPRRAGAADALVFPSNNGGAWSDMTLSMIVRRLGLDSTVHGWRAVFRMWGARAGHPRELLELALAHAVGGVEGAYHRDDLLERRRPIMASWAAFLIDD